MAWTTLTKDTTITAAEVLDNFFHSFESDLLPRGGLNLTATADVPIETNGIEFLRKRSKFNMKKSADVPIGRLLLSIQPIIFAA